MPATIRASCLIGGLREAPQCDSARLDDRRPGRDGTIGSPRRPPTLAVRAHLEARDIVLAYRAGVAFGEARPHDDRDDASVHDLTSLAVTGGSGAIRHVGSTGFRGDLAWPTREWC